MSSMRCRICGVETQRHNAHQQTCKSEACKRQHRRDYRKCRYYDDRDDPVCVWCHKPILEIGKRKYHPRCHAEKERSRVKLYYLRGRHHGLRGKPRNYKDLFECFYCGKEAPRKSARQFVCSSRECYLKRRREEKRRATAAKHKQEVISCRFCGKQVIKRSRIHYKCDSQVCKSASLRLRREQRWALTPLLCEICELPVQVRRGHVRYHKECRRYRNEVGKRASTLARKKACGA